MLSFRFKYEKYYSPTQMFRLFFWWGRFPFKYHHQTQKRFLLSEPNSAAEKIVGAWFLEP